MLSFKKILLCGTFLVLGCGTTVFASECGHANVNIVEKQPAACTEAGYDEGVYCNDCRRYIEGHERLNSLGHIDSDHDNICDDCEEVLEIKEELKATCTEDGYTGDVVGDDGRIVYGKTIPATGHVDTNTDYKCDICSNNITKEDIMIKLHYYVSKEEYNANKTKYQFSNYTVKELCDIDTCVYITELVKTKQGTELHVPDFPISSRFYFQWVDVYHNVYQKFTFDRNTELYMVYSKDANEQMHGQAGDDAYWSYLPEQKYLYFYGTGRIWNHYEKRAELPWYDYLIIADKVKVDGGIQAEIWTIAKKWFGDAKMPTPETKIKQKKQKKSA